MFTYELMFFAHTHTKTKIKKGKEDPTMRQAGSRRYRWVWLAILATLMTVTSLVYRPTASRTVPSSRWRIKAPAAATKTDKATSQSQRIIKNVTATHHLCVIAGASFLDRDLVRIMAQSLFLSPPSLDHVHLFLYDSDPEAGDSSAFLMNATVAVQRFVTLLSREDLEREGCEDDMSAAVSAAARRRRCGHVTVSGGRVFYGKHFSSMAFRNASHIYSFNHLTATSQHPSYSIPATDSKNRTVVCCFGAALPMSLVTSQAVVLDRLSPNECMHDRCLWVIRPNSGQNVKITNFMFDEAPPLPYSSVIVGDRTIAIDNPRSSPPAEVVGAETNVCMLVRTYSADKLGLDSLIRSVLMNSQRNRMKIFVVNPQAVSRRERRATEEAWLKGSLLAFDSEQVRGLYTEDLQVTDDRMKHIDPFGYVVTDAALQHSAMTSLCDYYIVTNGDNMYRPQYFSAVFSLIDLSPAPPELIMTDFINRYIPDVLRVKPIRGSIDLGAGVFTRDQYLSINFANDQSSIEEWNLSDGVFFEKLNKRLPDSRKVTIHSPLFYHQ